MSFRVTSFLTVVRRLSTDGGVTRCLQSQDITFPVAIAQILDSDSVWIQLLVYF